MSHGSIRWYLNLRKVIVRLNSSEVKMTVSKGESGIRMQELINGIMGAGFSKPNKNSYLE